MNSRRHFLKKLGLGAAALPFISNLSAFASRAGIEFPQAAAGGHVQPERNSPVGFLAG